MTKTEIFDPADYLTTPEARAEYITAAFETGDVAFIRDAISTVAKAVGMAKVAEQAGLTREGLYKALGRSGNPQFGTVVNLMPALQLRLSAQPAKPKASKRRMAGKPVRAKPTTARRRA